MKVLGERQPADLVNIGAYALMPNHFHLLLQERELGGITEFMRRVGTGYAMYFNKLNGRVGTLFSSRFKAKHVTDDLYFKRLINYIHANPAEIVEKGWKEGIVEDALRAEHFLRGYPFSSLPEYLGIKRAENVLIAIETMKDYFDDISVTSIENLLEEAVIFGRENIKDGP